MNFFKNCFNMKSKAYNGRVNHMSDDEYYRRISDLTNSCKGVEVFEFEGCYFSGSIVGTVKAYLKENPAKTFFVWLIDSGLEVKQQS